MKSQIEILNFKTAIVTLNTEGILKTGGWIKPILDLLRTEINMSQFVLALILLNRYNADILKKSKKTDEDLNFLFASFANPGNKEKIFTLALAFIIANEQKLLKHHQKRPYEIQKRYEIIVTLQWIQHAIDSLGELLPNSMLIDLIQEIQESGEYKRPMLVFASYLILNKLKQPARKIIPFMEEKELDSNTLYYTIENETLVCLKFNEDCDVITKNILPQDKISLLESPGCFLQEIIKIDPSLASCHFDIGDMIENMLSVDKPFIYTILLEKCFSLPFWVDNKNQPLIPEIILNAKIWSQNSELFNLIMRLPKSLITPSFFHHLFAMLNISEEGRKDTSVLCEWIKTNFFTANPSTSEFDAASGQSSDVFYSLLYQKNRFFQLFPSDTPGPSLSLIQEMKKETFYEI